MVVTPTNKFLFIFAVRLVNALSLATFFQPDEYFQSLEVFDGWRTWEWNHGLRSIAYPALFKGVYTLVDILSKTLKLSPSTQAELNVVAPKVVGALFAAIGDAYTVQFARLIWGRRAARYAMAITLSSAFHWFCFTRTFTNCLETTLTIMALYYWPWEIREPGFKDKSGKIRDRELHDYGLRVYDMMKALTLAAMAFTLRPTNVLIWLPLGMLLLWQAPLRRQKFMISVTALVIGVGVLGANFMLDSWFYHEPRFPPLQFIRFNVIQSLSHFYGVNRWDYYLTEGLPILLIAYVPLALYTIKHSWQLSLKTPAKQLVIMFVCVIPVFSFIGHKEVRFIYPLLPPLHALMAGVGLPSLPQSWSRIRMLLYMLIINALVAFYASQVHQRGVIDVVHWLRKSYYQDMASNKFTKTFGFLMPCHSTPWASYLQGASEYGFALTCEPPINLTLEQRVSYLDEADIFYKTNPSTFLYDNFPPPPVFGKDVVVDHHRKYQWPDYLIMFGAAKGVVGEHLGAGDGKTRWQGTFGKSRYWQCKKFFNSHVHDDSRRKGKVIIWCLDRE